MFTVASQVSAGPYAEWGMFDGKSLSELQPGMKVPDLSEVPIPPPPGGKFINVSGDRFCTMGLKTDRAVEEVCDYYESKLLRLGYDHVDLPYVSSNTSCAIYKNGDTETDVGVMVDKDEDTMFIENGGTLVLINYLSSDGGSCWH